MAISFYELKAPLILQTNHSVGAPVSLLRRWLQSFLPSKSDALALIAEDDYWSLFAKKHPKIRTEVIVNGISHQANKVNLDASDKTFTAGSLVYLLIASWL